MRSSEVLVTGGTGFLGRHLVRLLLGAGHRVRVLCRAPAPELEAQGVAVSLGSVLDPVAVQAATRGCAFVFHLAGRVSRDPRDADLLRELHVSGTQHVVEAAAEQGVERLLYASTSGTLACAADPLPLATEESPRRCSALDRWPYYVTKREAEDLAISLAQKRGLDLVSLNPSLLLGPGDLRLSSTGDVARILERRLPAIPSGGINLVDVRDVAAAFVEAMERGRAGTRYLLGAVNWTLDEFIKRVALLGSVPPPRLRAPDTMTRWAARIVEPAERWMNRTPSMDLASVEMSQVFWYFDSGRAREELNFSPRDVGATIRDTIDDLRRC